MYNNIEKYNKLTMEPFNGIFHSINMFQFYSTTSPVLCTINKKPLNERKEDILYLWLLQCIMLYQKM